MKAALKIIGGEKIRQARKEKTWTQAELAKKAGVGRTTIIHIENGKIAPNVATLGKIAAALGLEDDFVKSYSASTSLRVDMAFIRLAVQMETLAVELRDPETSSEFKRNRLESAIIGIIDGLGLNLGKRRPKNHD